MHPWPGKRSFHIAACLDYGGQHERLLISGGCDDDSTHDDMWLMDPQSGRMEEVRNRIKVTCIHCNKCCPLKLCHIFELWLILYVHDILYFLESHLSFFLPFSNIKVTCIPC